MRKYKLILVVFLVFSLPLFSENESGKVDYLKEVTGEYYDIFGNVDGGVRVMLNSKSYVKEDFELYFKVYRMPRQFMDETDKTREGFEQIFNRNFLEKYYSNSHIPLKNGDKFLYGRIYRTGNHSIFVLELHFIDKNNEKKTKIYQKSVPSDVPDKSYEYLDEINKNAVEGYFMAPLMWEGITLITENKKLFLQRDLWPESVENLYNFLFDLFKDEIPEEYFEIRNREVPRYSTKSDVIRP